MIISKSRALRYMRCPRSIAYENMEHKKLDSVSVFNENYTLEDFYKEEHKEKLISILNMIYENFDEENADEQTNLIDKNIDTRNLEIYDNDFKKIEEFSAIKAKNMFGGDVTYSPYNNKLQKLFSYNITNTDYTLTSLIDVYQEDKESIRIIEVKATTDRKFREDIKFGLPRKKKLLFEFNEFKNIFELAIDDLKLISNDKKIFDIYDTIIGRFIFDMSFQYYIIKNSLNTNKKVKYFLSVLNSTYIYDGKKNEDGERVYDADKLMSFIDITPILEYFYSNFSNYINNMVKDIDKMSIQADAPLQANKEKAKPSIKCRYANICLNDYNIPETNSIFTYIDNHHGFIYKDKKVSVKDLLDLGISSMLDLKPEENLKRLKNICQYKSVLENKRYIERHIINNVLKKALVYPLFHLDFESIAHPIPMFKGEKPYTQSLFQYSIHIQWSRYECDEKKDNYFYLNKDCQNDYRKEFVESMLNVLEKDEKGSIIVYNQAFEETRIKELQKIFPEFEERLEKVRERLFDLMKVLKGSKDFIKKYTDEKGQYDILFYDPEQNGSYSIKKILPLYSDRSYLDISCHNGIDAVYFFSKLKSEKEIDYYKKRQDLIQYCGLDTYSMYIILDGLLKEVENY